jgi:LysR family hydrogen peroxide-inducible transcriptional activator
MTVTQLECFLAVVKSKNFRNAAKSLGKTQPALSLQIQRLETSLGATLFERPGKFFRLTSAAEILVPHAEKILAEVKESHTKIQEIREGGLGLVRVGVLPTVAAHFLPVVMRKFKQRFPKLRVVLHEEYRTPLLVPLVQSSEIDIILALRPLRSAGLRSQELLTESLSVAVSFEHPLARARSVAIAELENEKFILYKNPHHGTREATLQACRTAGFEPHVEFESEQAETIQNLVAINLGITLMPDMVLRDRATMDLARVAISPVAPTRTIAASWKPGRFLSVAAREFLNCATEVGREWTTLPNRHPLAETGKRTPAALVARTTA